MANRVLLWQLRIGELEMRQTLSLPFSYEGFRTLSISRPAWKRKQHDITFVSCATLDYTIHDLFGESLTFSSLVLYFSI